MAGVFGSLFGLSSIFTARTTLKNGREQRDLQEKLHKQDSADARERFLKDFDLRERQLSIAAKQIILQERQIVEAGARYNNDVLRAIKKEQTDRISSSLRQAYAGSLDGIYLAEHHAMSTLDMKALRIFFQRPDEMSDVEDLINAAVVQYERHDNERPIQFVTGNWNEKLRGGNWTAYDFHALDPTIPTSILRIKKTKEGDYALETDLFGFAIGGKSFHPSRPIGRIPNDSKQAEKIMPLLALAAADMHFLSTYAKMPLLPFVLAENPPEGEDMAPLVDEIVTSYRRIINAMLEERPEMGVYASLKLVEAFAAFPDKSHALDQLRNLEKMTMHLLPEKPELQSMLSQLYSRLGEPEDATRLAITVAPRKMITSGEARKSALEHHR